MTAQLPGLLAAILAVQKEAPKLAKDATNPHFKSKYTPLDTIVETIGPILNKHGLVWLTLPGTDEHGNPALHYELIHAKTGEAKTGTMPLLLSKQDAQGLGSALTYARRYVLTSVLNLVADEDDDGARAGSKQQSQRQPPAEPPAPTTRQVIYGHASGRLQALQLLNVIREVKGAQPFSISEQDAMTRLDAAISNVKDDEVALIIAKIDEVAGA